MPVLRAVFVSVAVVLLILAKLNAQSAPSVSDSQFWLAIAALIVALVTWLADKVRRRTA